MSTKDKFALQDDEYVFPYHYVPTFEPFTPSRIMYSAVEYVGYMQPIVNKLAGMSWQSLLDVGCGDARMIYELMPLIGERRVKGIDLSRRAILFAQAFNDGNGAEIACEDIKDISETFDVVTAIETLEHIPDEEIGDFVKQIHSRLNKEGTLLVSVPTTNFPLQKKHYRQYDLPLLLRHVPSELFTLTEYHFYIRGWDRFKLFVRIAPRIAGWKFAMKVYEWAAKKWFYSASDTNGLHLVAVFEKK